MKRKSNIILGLILLIVTVLSLTIFAKEQVFHFRQTNWGMSKDQVSAIEGRKPDYEENDMLYYIVNIFGGNHYCFYSFLEDKLYKGGYFFIEEHTDKNLYINDYMELMVILTKEYGKPIMDEIVWKNDLYKDEKSEWGTAISLGDLEYWAFWETLETEICLSLDSDNYEINLILSYGSKVLNEWVKKINEEKTTMDTLYDNLEESMKDEDIELLQELTNKAVGLLPENEREKLIELQTRFGKYGYSSLTENENHVMQELNKKAINLLSKNDRIKLDGLLKKVDDSLSEETKMVQMIRKIFPALSQESAEKFVRKANDRNLSDEEFLAWADELAAQGENYLSLNQLNEMASLWWKAVDKLPEEQQGFIQSVTAKMRLGQQLTLEESEAVSIFISHGFTLLNQEDHERYLYLRSKALEEALIRE